MDVSRQTIGEDTSAGVSMYLSFDSNSTMSSAAYKTLSDFSTLSTMEVDELHTVEEELSESHHNSTLEANESHLKTVKKAEAMPLGTVPPLRAFSKNILQDFKAISSTPTKEQLMRSVEVLRGSEVERCMDLGEAFMGIEDDKPNEFFLEENKENALPESEGSTLSTSSEIVTSVIEQKQMTQLSTTAAEESLKTRNDNSLDAEAVTPTPDSKTEYSDVFQELPSNSSLWKPKKLNTNSRKSLCEPNLETNRPSRIAIHAKHRASFSLTSQMGRNDIANMPKLLDKMLKISTRAPENKKTEYKKASNSKTVDLQRKPIATGVRAVRNSMLPNVEKRPYNITHRMSVLVKTTLNSPARKMARKSLLSFPGQAAQNRKPVSNAATKTARRSELSHAAPPRHSMLPTIVSAAQNRQAGGEDQSLVPKLSLRQSLLPKMDNKPQQLDPIVELTAKPKSKNPIKSKTGPVPAKPDTSIFSCHQCLRQFRVKSLFDAHKRSHVEEIPMTQPVSLIKKPSETESTQCKYCDKKFAIVRALHIHLMQNCPKIPAGEKRKLQFTEMNHVEKAQLPSVFATANSNNASSTSKTLKKSHSNLSSSDDSAVGKKETKNAFKNEAAQEDSRGKMAAPPISKLKKKAAHAGVYRTPSKTVPCHLCKQKFKSILDYTNHSMNMHPTITYKAPTSDPRNGL